MGSDRVEFALSPQVPNIHCVIITSSRYVVAETRKERKERKRERELSSSKPGPIHTTLNNWETWEVIKFMMKVAKFKFCQYIPNESHFTIVTHYTSNPYG